MHTVYGEARPDAWSLTLRSALTSTLSLDHAQVGWLRATAAQGEIPVFLDAHRWGRGDEAGGGVTRATCMLYACEADGTQRDLSARHRGWLESSMAATFTRPASPDTWDPHPPTPKEPIWWRCAARLRAPPTLPRHEAPALNRSAVPTTRPFAASPTLYLAGGDFFARRLLIDEPRDASQSAGFKRRLPAPVTSRPIGTPYARPWGGFPSGPGRVSGAHSHPEAQLRSLRTASWCAVQPASCVPLTASPPPPPPIKQTTSAQTSLLRYGL